MTVPGALSTWLCSILPASGTSIQASVLYAITDFQFLTMPGAAQNIVRARLIISGEHRGGNHHAEQQHQKSHDILVVQDGGAHAGIDGLFADHLLL